MQEKEKGPKGGREEKGEKRKGKKRRSTRACPGSGNFPGPISCAGPGALRALHQVSISVGVGQGSGTWLLSQILVHNQRVY